MELNKKNRKHILFIVFAGILFYVCLQNIASVGDLFKWILALIFPFVLGSSIAFILNVPMKKIESHLFKRNGKGLKFRRPIAFAITLVAVILVLLAGLFIVIPDLVNTGNALIMQIPNAFEDMEKNINSLEKEFSALQNFQMDFNIDWDKIVQEIVEFVQSSVSALLNSTINVVGNILSAIATFFIGFTFSIYLLFQKEKLLVQSKKIFYAIFPVKAADKIIYIGKISNTAFSNFISGQCTEAIILGIMFVIAMSIFRMPYAILVGVLIAISALIPIFGAFIGCVVGVFLIAMVNPMQAVWFVVLFFILQQFEGNVIYPHVVGGKVGLPSIWVLVAVTFGGKLMGIAGMLIFIPLCSVSYSLLKDYVTKRLKEKQISADKYSQ